MTNDDLRTDDWIGKTIGPWLVKEQFRNSQGRNAYLCEHVETGKVKGFVAYRLHRMIREGRA